MRKVTGALHEYVEAKRHLWNTYFRNRFKSIYECPILDEYEQISRLLFGAIVLSEAEALSDQSRQELHGEPWRHLRVGLNSPAQVARIRVSDPIKDHSRAWNDFTTVQLEKDASFGFIDIFDWEPYGFVTYPYIRATIDNESRLNDLLGREALIEIANACVWIRTED